MTPVPARAPQDPVRVGVIGASPSGGWALQAHVPALLALPGFRLQAVCTTRPESAAALADRYGIPGAYADAGAMARDPDVDLVTVAVKVRDHGPAVRAALNAGKDVYCEWPLAADSTGAKDLHSLAVERGLRHVIGLQARAAPAVLRMRTLVADGYVGRVLSTRAFSAGMGLGGPELPADREWAAQDAAGLSVLSVRTAHTMDALTFCAGPLVEQSAEVLVATPNPLIAGTGRRVVKTAPDQVVISGRHVDGASMTGHFLLGANPLRTPLLTVMGTAGTLALVPDTADGQIQFSPLALIGSRNGTEPETLVEPDHDDLPADVPPGPPAGIARMYRAIGRSLRDDRSADVPGFDHAVWLHGLLDDIRRAASSGRRQQLTQPPG